MLLLVGGGVALIGAPPVQQYNLTGAGVPTDSVTGVGTVPNGGYVLSIALAGLRAELQRRHPLSVTAHYLGPCVAGPVEVAVETLKAGRSLSTASAHLIQDGRVKLAVLATFGDLGLQEGPSRVTAARPVIPEPEECAGRDQRMTNPFPVAPEITKVIDLRLAPASATAMLAQPANAGGGARIDAWVRFADGRPVDVDSLPLLCDALPPAVFTVMRTGWVPTLELTVHVRGLPKPDWLQAVITSRAIINGLLEEDCELWDREGNLVAMSRQLARVLPPQPA